MMPLKQQDNRQEVYHVLHGLKTVLAGTLPGLSLCVVLLGFLKNNVAEAGAESFLPTQDITLSGNVTAPSCTVKLENDQLTFSRPGDNDKSVTGREEQILRLNLSNCEADGVGVTFKAEHWPDDAVRGILAGAQSRRRTPEWYYTIGPGSQEGDTPWPLNLAKDSPVPDVDKMPGDKKQDVYFSLAEVNYWYDLREPLKETDALVIPFSIRVHHGQTSMGGNIKKEGSRNNNDEDTLNATFTLQLSWR